MLLFFLFDFSNPLKTEMLFSKLSWAEIRGSEGIFAKYSVSMISDLLTSNCTLFEPQWGNKTLKTGSQKRKSKNSRPFSFLFGRISMEVSKKRSVSKRQRKLIKIVYGLAPLGSWSILTYLQKAVVTL